MTFHSLCPSEETPVASPSALFRTAVLFVFLLTASLAFTLSQPVHAQTATTPVYVDASATGANDGSSWSDAYTSLQDALGAAGSDTEIRIAEGTYYPDVGSTVTDNDRTASFRIDGNQDGLQIKGGYPAGGGTRDLSVHETVLSGDIDGDGTNIGNSYHVVYIDGVSGGGVTRATVLDGITISDGNASGSGTTSTSKRKIDSSPAGPDPEELIPGQYIVTFADGPSASKAFGNKGVWETARENMRQRAREVLATVSSAGGAAKQSAEPVVERTYAAALAGFTASGLTPDMVDALRADPRIKRVEQDAIVQAGDYEDGSRGAEPSGLAAASATQTDAPWGLDRIDARAGLDDTFTYDRTGAGVTAYVLDSGIRPSHNEFEGRASIGADFIGDGQNGQDCHGHGTHVAGTVGGATYGVAKDVSIVAVRVLNCQNSGSKSGVIAGMDWVAANAQLPAVVNMSLGGRASATEDEAVTRLVNAGVSTFVAAGNDDRDACLYSPARAEDAVTVGATDDVDARASFSNYGSCVDINAPGVDIPSAWYQSDTDVNTISGTSMASPHVAGVAALYLEANPSASPTDVRTAITGAATTGTISDPNGSPNLLVYSSLSQQATTAAWKGAGVYCDGAGGVCSPTFTRVVFTRNTTDGWGGALYANGQSSGESNPLVINGVFVGNQASRGGAIYSDGRDQGGSSPIILNSTFSKNGLGVGRSVFANGAQNGSSHPQTINSILAESGKEVWLNEATSTHDHTLIQGGCPTGATCTASVAGPVRFVNAFTPAGDDGTFGTPDDGLALVSGSSALNAGRNDALDIDGDGTRDVETDLLGRMRPMDSGDTVDLGAYEGGVPIPTIYVDADASGTEDGASWENAYSSLTTAIGNAGRNANIWVAAGTYTPGTDRADSFTFTGAKPSLKIYGGFEGTETSLAERDLSAGHTTILSGDIGVQGDPSDNSYHVLLFDGQNEGALTSDLVIDGVTVTGGTADGSFPENAGGGMYCNGYAGTCSPRLQNVIFHGNTARYGGAIYAYGAGGNSQFQLINSVLVNNDAEWGGAINCFGSSGVCRPVITNATISANTATRGGGVFSQSGSSGGDASPRLTNVILWGNSAQTGPELYNSYSGATPVLRHTLVEGGASAVYNASGGSIIYADTDGNAASTFSASSNIAGSPRFNSFSDLDGADNVFGTPDDGLTLQPVSPAINAGTNAQFEPGGLLAGIATDVLGSERIQTGTADLGAYETAVPHTPNRALALDGVDDFVTADGVSDAVAAASAFTVEAWVRPARDDGSQQGVLSFHTDAGGNQNIVFYRNGTFAYYDGSTSYRSALLAFPPGQWYHVAVTVDASDAGTLYVNGRREATFTTMVRPTLNGRFSIGQEWDGSGPTATDFFEGAIDEVRVWSAARTQADIQAGMYASLGESSELSGADGLEGYYRFEGNAFDATGTRHGTVRGGAGYRTDVPVETAKDRLIVRVDASVSGGDSNGTAWSDAHAGLQAGLRGTGPENQVWIAGGTYTPSKLRDVSDPRSATFELTGANDGVKVYGGFAGTETALTDRDLSANYETVLSGEIDGDGTRSGNAYHVLYFDGIVEGPITGATVLNGVTVTGGNADVIPSVDTSIEWGGGAYLADSSPRLDRVVFDGNFADVNGGAIYSNGGSPVIANSVFVDNRAFVPGSFDGGGAIYHQSGRLVIMSTTFTGNDGGFVGGAIFSDGDVDVSNSTFSNNSASEGGAIRSDGGILNIVHSSFENNRASDGGGAVYFPASGKMMQVANTAAIGNTADRGGAFYVENALLNVSNTVFFDNAASDGGAIYSGDFSSIALTNTTLVENSATSRGGALSENGGQPTITNSILRQNTAPSGSSIYVDDSNTILSVRLTLSHTLVEGGASGILADNGAGFESTTEGGGTVDGFGGTNVTGDPLFVDAANPVGSDGVFGTADDGLQVMAESPVLDGGDTAALPVDIFDLDGDGDTTEPLPFDLTGRKRVIDNDDDGSTAARVDIGAYEAPSGTKLPVELAGFSATASGDAVTLSWRTLSETNNAGFDVERRTGASKSWTSLTRITGAGTTTEAQTYRFEDTTLPYAADSLTYRLRQVDVDGAESFSKEIVVARSRAHQLELLGTYPNPAQTQATVHFAVPEDVEDARLMLYDLLGRKVRSFRPGATGRQTMRLDTDGLASGVYFLRLTGGGQAKTQKMTVVR